MPYKNDGRRLAVRSHEEANGRWPLHDEYTILSFLLSYIPTLGRHCTAAFSNFSPEASVWQNSRTSVGPIAALQVSFVPLKPSNWRSRAACTLALIVFESSTFRLSVVSHTVEALTSHALQTLADYVHQHSESYQHITTTPL